MGECTHHKQRFNSEANYWTCLICGAELDVFGKPVLTVKGMKKAVELLKEVNINPKDGFFEFVSTGWNPGPPDSIEAKVEIGEYSDYINISEIASELSYKLGSSLNALIEATADGPVETGTDIDEGNDETEIYKDESWDDQPIDVIRRHCQHEPKDKALPGQHVFLHCYKCGTCWNDWNSFWATHKIDHPQEKTIKVKVDIQPTGRKFR